MQPQLTLPIPFETNPTILGCPIVNRVWHDPLKTWIEVVEGRFAGGEYIYLIHLDQRLSRIQHYLGSTSNLIRRRREHQRVYPCFRFTDEFFQQGLFRYGIDQQVIDALQPLRGRTFRRYNTVEKAIVQTAGREALIYKFIILKATRRHTTNGILMAANQRKIPWRMVRIFQADRSLEQALKKRKHSFRLICPACQGIEEPF